MIDKGKIRPIVEGQTGQEVANNLKANFNDLADGINANETALGKKLEDGNMATLNGKKLTNGGNINITGEVEEAPTDGALYGRNGKEKKWQKVPTGGGGGGSVEIDTVLDSSSTNNKAAGAKAVVDKLATLEHTVRRNAGVVGILEKPLNKTELKGTLPDEAAYKGYYIDDLEQAKLRGNILISIDVDFFSVGKFSVIKTTNLLTTTPEELQYEVIEKFTISKTGKQRLFFSYPLILLKDEWIGVKVADDSAKFRFGGNAGTSFYYALSGYNTWKKTPTDLCIQFNGIKIEEKKSPLFGKRISIIGDSISTFRGFIPQGYETFYPQGDVTDVEKTWWNILLNRTGAILGANCSWSGSTVRGDGLDKQSAAAGCSDKRVADVGANGTPDIIIVYMGINDFGPSAGVLGDWTAKKNFPTNGTKSTFSESYALLLSKLILKYPDSQIFCCTIMQSGKESKDAVEPNVYPTKNSLNIALNEYNDIIKDLANGYGCPIIDLSNCGIRFGNFEKYTIGDLLHPNAKGHERMESVIENTITKYVV